MLTRSTHPLHTTFKVVLGYSTGRVLAVERGEVDGTGSTLQNIPAMAPHWTEKDYRLLAINAPERLAKYPDVPTMVEFAKTSLARQMLEFWMYQSATARAIFSPPGVPAERVEALRRAFDQTVRDPAFLAERERLQTLIEASSGQEGEGGGKASLWASPAG